MALRRDQKTLLAAAVASLALWAVPGLRILALPLVYLNTHIHELCHALTAIATGGAVEKIVVFGNGSGVTPVAGGSLLLTASAGYVGSAVIGGLSVAGARNVGGAKTVLRVLCIALALSLLLFVRGDLLGIASAAFWILLFGYLSTKLEGDNATFAAQFVGVQLALTSLQALLVLLHLSADYQTMSDAKILESVTGLPAMVWALGWSALGVTAILASLSRAWKPASRAAPRS